MLLLLLLVTPLALSSDVEPDETGLVGTPYMYDVNSAAPRAQVPLKFWANPRDAALKPRRRDRSPHRLMQLMGPDFDPRWMRRTRREDKLLNASSSSGVGTRSAEGGPEERRPSVLALWEAALALQPPPSWPAPPSSMLFLPAASLGSSASPAAWLVSLASCPARQEWRDLGVFFWPRFVRFVDCERTAKTKPGAAGGHASCGWPPGRLRCAPGVAKTLHLLRWHCKLRGGGDVWARLAGMLSPGKGKSPPPPPQHKKSRKRYRCEWLKVPYPVPADCQCGGV